MRTVSDERKLRKRSYIPTFLHRETHLSLVLVRCSAAMSASPMSHGGANITVSIIDRYQSGINFDLGEEFSLFLIISLRRDRSTVTHFDLRLQPQHRSISVSRFLGIVSELEELIFQCKFRFRDDTKNRNRGTTVTVRAKNSAENREN